MKIAQKWARLLRLHRGERQARYFLYTVIGLWAFALVLSV